jgi:hypothetical protein
MASAPCVMSACRPRWRRKHMAIMERKRERPLPCMRWKGPPSPAVARSDLSARGPAEPATIAWQSLDELRSTRCPPLERRLPRAARQLVDPVANSGLQAPALANSRSLCSLTLRFPPEPGHRLWWRARCLPPPKDLRKRPEEPISRFFARVRVIHRRRQVTPRSRRVIHQLSTGSSTRRPSAGRDNRRANGGDGRGDGPDRADTL